VGFGMNFKPLSRDEGIFDLKMYLALPLPRFKTHILPHKVGTCYVWAAAAEIKHRGRCTSHSPAVWSQLASGTCRLQAKHWHYFDLICTEFGNYFDLIGPYYVLMQPFLSLYMDK
jgi:hypothetical protein